MLVRFDGLDEPTRLDGVWRYPGETTALPDARAKEYLGCGLALAADGTPAAQVVAEPPRDPAERASEVQLFLNGCEVTRCPERRGVAVSVIVPMFRSAAFLPKLIASLEGSDSTPRELIFVSDGDGRPDVPDKLIVLPENRGFAAAVNAGARHATGEFLCLLNADVEVHENWLAPMVRFIASASDVGAVGNCNLDGQGRIDSIGSEFSHATGHCEHILIGSPDVPGPQRNAVAERDMITAACLLVRRSAWERIGGFDEAYRIGYFEDSDLCMRLRQAAYRILYCPDSVITHHKNHSGAGRHRFYPQNMDRFHRRWVRTGLVDKFARRRGRKVHDGDVVACYIILNEEEYIQASLESIYPLADRIVIVEGGNDYAVAAGLCNPDKRSADSTVERIKAFPDPDGKIELIQGAWKDKADQRNAYAERLRTGDWMVLMDGDEVFYEAGLWRLSALMHKHEIIQPGFHLFWNDLETLGTDVWERYPQVKVVRWREGYHYRDHNCPSDGQGRLITAARRPRLVNEPLYAHYAWVKPLAKIRKKAAYYELQPGARERMRRNYVEDVFLAWRRRPLETVSRFGTHPFGGGGAAPFLGEHPAPIRRRLDAGELSRRTTDA